MEPESYIMADTNAGNEWSFLMSSLEFQKRKVTEFDFCHRINLRILCGIQPDYTEVQLDSVKKTRAMEDSLFDIAEKKRCAALKDSLRSISGFEKDLSECCEIYTGDTTTIECRALRNFRVLEYSPDDLEKRSQIDSTSKKYYQAGFSFYPNPAADYITLEFEDISASEITVINVKGGKVLTEKITGPTQILDVSNFIPGTYFIHLNKPFHVAVKKMVVE